MSRRGWAYFLAMAVIWGIPYLLIRVAVRELNPGVLVFLRTAPAALLLAPLVVARGQLRALRTHLGWIAVFGVVEFGIPWFLMSTSEQHITSSLTSLLICCVPLFAVVAQRIRRTEDVIAANPASVTEQPASGSSRCALRRARSPRWTSCSTSPA